MSDTIIYKLKSPITVEGGAALEQVTLREPIVADMIACDEAGPQGSTLYLIALLSRMAGLSDESFHKVSTRDALAMKKLADETWGNAEEDGETPPS